MSIFSKIGSLAKSGLKATKSGFKATAESSLIRNNPQGLGLINYAVNNRVKGESGFGAYGTPLKLLGAGGALTLAAGAYSGATNRQDSDNALIGGMKGMLNSFSNFGENVLMPASIGVGVLAATGFTRKFETGYMLARRAGAARDSYSNYMRSSAAGVSGKELDELENAMRSSVLPGGRELKGPLPGSIDSKNAVDRTSQLIAKRGFDIFTSPTAPAEIISELIEKDSKAGGVFNQVFQGATSMGYAAGGFMGEVDTAITAGIKALKGGKYYRKTPDEIKEMQAMEIKAAEQAKNDPRTKSTTADILSFAGKAAGATAVLGVAAYAGASAGNTGYFAGSPLNVLSRGLSTSRNEADYIYSMEQQKMGQYEMVAAYNPSQAGMRDTDDAYSYARSMNPSSVNPMSPGLARTAGRQRNIAPGQYGDSGSLVFAMNTLRRG